MKVKVPKSVDVKKLIEKLNLSQTRSKNLKFKIYYLLSKVTTDNFNYKLNENNNGFRNISSIMMKRDIGNQDYYLIVKLLTNPDDPIIETNNSWHNPKKKNHQGFCKGYRLTENYNTGEVVVKTLPDKFNRHHTEDHQDLAMNEKYSFLLNQFNKNRISFDPLIYEYVKKFGIAFLDRVDSDNPYQKKMIFNKIGLWLFFIEKIKNNNVWSSVSSNNHRLNSSITGLPRILRPFLLCNDQPLGMIDISSSQPYILSSIMDDAFFNSNSTGYNLNTIYPELYRDLVSSSINNNIVINSDIISNNLFEYSSIGTNNVEFSFSNNSLNTHSFMWCEKMTYNEMENIRMYKQSPFYNDFYNYVLQCYVRRTVTNTSIDFKTAREKLKHTMMYVLFDNNIRHRNNDPYVRMFKSVFPGVDKWINEIHRLIGTQKFAYLLQRTESYLLLNVICREYNLHYPEVPLFTIHDSILSNAENIRALNGFTAMRLKEITGITCGIKIKYPQIAREPQINDIDQVWEDIGTINTEDIYEKKRAGVFSSNIEKGSNFLRNS
jgi:hypothetical protein